MQKARNISQSFSMALIYADDANRMSRKSIKIAKISEVFCSWGWILNQSKTENTTLKDMKSLDKEKLLGSFLSTTKDVSYREILAMLAMNKFNRIWKGKLLYKTRKIGHTLDTRTMNISIWLNHLGRVRNDK